MANVELANRIKSKTALISISILLIFLSASFISNSILFNFKH